MSVRMPNIQRCADGVSRRWGEGFYVMKVESTFSGKAITRAGETLIEPGIAEKDPARFEAAMAALSYWRSSHEKPLEKAYALLGRSALRIDQNAVLAKRLKRTPSIIAKLERFREMKLRGMQDIGGCRAILPTQKKVLKLVRELKARKDFRVKQYIESPKEDGYRGIHLIGDFSGGVEGKRSIEIQLRTQIQHAWATAVEIIDLFTGQAIKSNRGQERWKEFFKCASVQFALIEQLGPSKMRNGNVMAEAILSKLRGKLSPRNEEIQHSCERVYLLSNKLDVLENFRAFASTLKITDDALSVEPHDGYILLSIDVKKKRLSMSVFDKAEFGEAAEKYLEEEKQAAVSGQKVVVLVSTEAVGGIKAAYPNYFGDSSRFISLLSAGIEAYRRFQPNTLLRLVKKLWPA